METFNKLTAHASHYLWKLLELFSIYFSINQFFTHHSPCNGETKILVSPLHGEWLWKPGKDIMCSIFSPKHRVNVIKVKEMKLEGIIWNTQNKILMLLLSQYWCIQYLTASQHWRSSVENILWHNLHNVLNCFMERADLFWYARPSIIKSYF